MELPRLITALAGPVAYTDAERTAALARALAALRELGIPGPREAAGVSRGLLGGDDAMHLMGDHQFLAGVNDEDAAMRVRGGVCPNRAWLTIPCWLNPGRVSG